MLASRFSNARNVINSRTPIGDDQLRRVVPSIFADAAHNSRSDRYTYVPTSNVVTALRKEGFEPFFACQARARDESRREFTKHMLRLRHATQLAGSEVPEIILINSHDGTSSYQMLAGMFRFVCCNGMVIGNSIEEVRVHHKGDIVGDVIEGAYTVLDEFGRVRESAEEMKAITLSDGAQRAFASAALVAKYGDVAGGNFPVTVDQVLRPQRTDDAGADLWRTFNRTQENLVRGGLRTVSANGRRMRTRAVAGISDNVQLNRALWTLADEMKKIAA
jgi:hypothetical protein